MNKNHLKALNKIADGLQLSLDQSTGTIFGTVRGYQFCLNSVNDSLVFTLKFSLKQNGQHPEAELLKQVVKESKAITNCNIQGFQVFYNVKTVMTANKSIEKLEEVLDLVTQFLEDYRFTNCCQDCGMEENIGTYNVGGIPVICCDECFKAYSDAMFTHQQGEVQKKENLPAGIVGAILGSIVGVLAIILIGQLGYVAAISGLILSIATLKGYEMLGKKVSNLGMIISCMIMVVMVYVGVRLDWSISLANYWGDIGYFETFRYFTFFLEEGFIESNQFYMDLGLVYLFTAVGAIPTVITFLRDRKTQAESYKMN